MTYLYQLDIAPSEDAGEGEDWSEWYGSLAEAKRRRVQLIRADPDLDGHRYGEDYEIRRVTLPDLPRRALALALLRREYRRGEVVVPAYRRQRRTP